MQIINKCTREMKQTNIYFQLKRLRSYQYKASNVFLKKIKILSKDNFFVVLAH